MKLGPRMVKQNAGRILESVCIICGILLFAAFIHHQNAFKVIAFFGLLISVIIIHISSRNDSILKIIGLVPVNRRLPIHLFIALFLGCGSGILARLSYNLSTIPVTLTYVAIVAPLIGITEEIIFRGFLQGHTRKVGIIFSVLFATTGHTLYKLAVIISLQDQTVFNYLHLAIFTFTGGILFSFLREFSKSVIPPAFAHACFDIILYGGFTLLPLWVWN